jgi:Na+-translocating ferredoxin:NAD+ oxidoreductase RnfD subunit
MKASNFAMVVVLVAFQWTGVLPWGFTIDISGAWDWLLPLAIVMLGMRLNLLFTGRIPTVTAWLVTFIALGAGRALVRHTPVWAELVPLTGVAMVLFTFYMITDPQTSPSRFRSQILFGSGIAFAYSVLLLLHVQYTMFYSVTTIAALRGLGLCALSLRRAPAPEPARAPAVAAPGF